MTINIFVLKGDLNRRGAFLFFCRVYIYLESEDFYMQPKMYHFKYFQESKIYLYTGVLEYGRNLTNEKRVFVAKFHFNIKRSTDIYVNGLHHFYQQTSSLMGHQTKGMTNMFLSFYD